MRLLNVTTLCLEEFDDDQIPRYAVLSHRWQPEEVLFRDMENDTANTKKGFVKLRMACKRANWDGLSHIWIDTCCIDKSSSAELSEAINSMYRIYEEAALCYAYEKDLFDVESPEPGTEVDFTRSVWFRRSWTLQELLAPKDVVFYDREWRKFGTKGNLAQVIADITGISERALDRNFEPEAYSVAQRMSWASQREATRKEDIAYSLMGIFEINMPMLYGEGTKAFTRLQEEIIKRFDDQSIFAWDCNDKFVDGRLLAASPADFKSCSQVSGSTGSSPFAINNVGLEIELDLMTGIFGTKIARLKCLNSKQQPIGIYLKAFPDNQESTFVKVSLPRESDRNCFESRYEGFFRAGLPFERKVTIYPDASLILKKASKSFLVRVLFPQLQASSFAVAKLWYRKPEDNEFRALPLTMTDLDFWLSFDSPNGLTSTQMRDFGCFVIPSATMFGRLILVKLRVQETLSSSVECEVSIIPPLSSRSIRNTECLKSFRGEAQSDVRRDVQDKEGTWICDGSCVASTAADTWILRSNEDKTLIASSEKLGLLIRMEKVGRWKLIVSVLGNALDKLTQATTAPHRLKSKRGVALDELTLGAGPGDLLPRWRDWVLAVGKSLNTGGKIKMFYF